MKIKMKICGSRVHGVGYRPWLIEAAIDSGLQGFYAVNRTENKIQTVMILVEGDEESISNFEEMVKNNKPQPAIVDSIEVEGHEGDVMSLDKYAAINTSTQLNKAIPLLLGMNSKMYQLLDKQDRMLNTISEIKDLRDDLEVQRNSIRQERTEKNIRIE